MKQIVAHKKLGTVQGLLLVAGLVLLLVFVNYVAIDLLARLLGYTASAVVFWVLGGLLAWYVLRIYVVSLVYELGSDVLRLSRKYGKRKRCIDDIYLSRIIYVGEPAQAKKRYPNAIRVNAVHAGCKDAVTAVVYQNSGSMRMALLQANAALKDRLTEQVRAN